MTNKCKTCKFWTIPEEYMGALELAAPRSPMDEWVHVIDAAKQCELFGYATAYCTSPNIKFYERPNKDGASVADGSEYMAVFITGEDFGCTLHEELT